MKKMAIEIDAEIHTNSSNQNEFKGIYLESVGIKTVRITNEDMTFLKPPSGGLKHLLI